MLQNVQGDLSAKCSDLKHVILLGKARRRFLAEAATVMEDNRNASRRAM